MNKGERINSYKEFRDGNRRIDFIECYHFLKGIDIQQVSTVINFDIPKSVHTYLHRIVRSLGDEVEREWELIL